MAITSTFFDGPVTEVDHAIAAGYIGRSKYGVVGTYDFRVTAGTGDRTVNVAPGSAWGAGIFTTSTATESVALPAPGIASRWYLIVLRRNWSGLGGTATLTYVAGGSAKTLPASINQNPGVIDDQPLAMVRVVSGQSAVAEIVDLRVWGDGYIFDELAMAYHNEPGRRLQRGPDQWYATQTGTWVKQISEDSGWASGSFASGWGASPPSGTGNGYLRCRRVAVGNTYLVDVRFSVYRRGGKITSGSTGDITNVTMGTIPAPYRPTYTAVALNHRDGGFMVSGAIYQGGEVVLSAIPPNTTVAPGQGFTFQATYLRD